MISFLTHRGWIILFLLAISLKKSISFNWISPDQEEILDKLTLIIHRNTEIEPCGTSDGHLTLLDAFQTIIKSTNLQDLSKYNFESLLSTALGVLLLPYDTCSGENEEVMPGLLSYCDMGNDRTPKLPDHESHVPIMLPLGSESLPCHFHTREGLRITSISMLIDAIDTEEGECAFDDLEKQALCESDAKQTLDLYAVAAGRVFMFAPKHVGEIFDLPHVPTSQNDPLSLEVLSVNPRVFEVHNFFTQAEGDQVIQHILAETDENMKLKRSSTGATGYTVNPQRTSEGGFDTRSPHAIKLKTRCFNMLGFEEYDEVFADGLQILRYNQTGGYIDHEDFLDDNNPKEEHDYDSSGIGTNRFATVLMYFNGAFFLLMYFS